MKIHLNHPKSYLLFGQGIWFYGMLSLCLLCVLIWQIPASWFANRLGSQTACRITLHQPQGSIWNGSAAIGFSEIDMASGVCRPPNAITERFQWNNECNILSASCKGAIEFSALKKPLQYSLSLSGLHLKAGEIILPVNGLEALGSPWSSLRPRGEMLMAWSDLTINSASNATPVGNIQIEMHDVSSAVSPVKPLGSYEIAITLLPTGGTWDVHTITGPLLIKGAGEIDHQQTHFSGEVSATPEAEEALVGLLSLLGKRNGDTYLIRF
jgi:general secretion pathway protein N